MPWPPIQIMMMTERDPTFNFSLNFSAAFK